MDYGHYQSRETASTTRAAGLLHPLITPERDTGNGYYVSVRHYERADELELTAIRLATGESMRRGGGAKRKNVEKQAMDEITLNKSIARARSNIRRKALSMCADRMLTLTFRENLGCIDEAWNRFKYFCKLMRFRYRERFQYIAVPEYQKRGAVHFHLAIAGHYEVGTVRRLWRRACGKEGGNIDITSPKKFGKKSWNPKRIANYISKYITKSEIVGFNKRRYSTGGKILLPIPERGWLALGVPVVQILRQVVESRSRKQIECVWESEGFFGIIYCST
jgi:hypothetical protein